MQRSTVGIFTASLLTVAICSLSCERSKAVPTVSCAGQGDFVKQGQALEGTVFYDSRSGSYGIQVATSFDSADMGYSCNLPAAYQKEQLKVRFSGRYYVYDKPVNGPAGYRLYYLVIESIAQ